MKSFLIISGLLYAISSVSLIQAAKAQASERCVDLFGFAFPQDYVDFELELNAKDTQIEKRLLRENVAMQVSQADVLRSHINEIGAGYDPGDLINTARANITFSATPSRDGTTLKLKISGNSENVFYFAVASVLEAVNLNLEPPTKLADLHNQFDKQFPPTDSSNSKRAGCTRASARHCVPQAP